MRWIISKILMNLKASKGGFKKEKMKPNYYVHSCVIDCHGNSMLHLFLNKIVSREWLFIGGDKVV